MKKAIVPLAILAMAALVAGAFALDCTRLAADARARVELVEGELHKHELRLVDVLAGMPKRSPEVDAAIAEYRAAGDMHARHKAYQQLVASYRQTMTDAVDPTNPLDRKFMDDIAGAINRREIAEPPYEKELAAYREFLSGTYGKMARRVSAQARADWDTAE